MPDRWQADLWTRAEQILPAHVFRYFAAGSRDEVTVREAEDAWHHWRLRPHVLRDVREPDLRTTLLGTSVASPIAIAPTSMQRWAHPDGEMAMLTAARDAGALAVVSSNAGTLFAELATVGADWWLQAYLTADRELIAPTLTAAVAAGARAVVLTVDTPFPGTKVGIDASAFGDLAGVYGVNHPDAVRGSTPGAEHARDLRVADLAWLRDLTGVPVVVKGVLRADDAHRCVDAGADAVWVSNHGGRQLDRSVSTATALPDVVDAVGADVEVYVDGGIRSGTDVLTAAGLGARGVFCGRLPLMALADGATAVRRALALLDDELREALVLAGCTRPADARDIVDRPVGAS